MLWLRAVAVWLVLITVEAVHGTLRTLFLQPYLGDFRARQVSVFTGIALILLIAWLFSGWLNAGSPRKLLSVGALWLVLTLLFEVGLGRLVLGYPWERILSDYDLSRGGLLSFGMIVLALAPLLAARWRHRPLQAVTPSP